MVLAGSCVGDIHGQATKMTPEVGMAQACSITERNPALPNRKQTSKQARKQTKRQTQTSKQTNKQTNKQTKKQTNQQTNKQTNSFTEYQCIHV